VSTTKKLSGYRLTEQPERTMSGFGDSRFKNPALKQLADQQVRFAPPAQRQEQMVRAEKLYTETDSTRQYPYQFVFYRIIGYRTDLYPDLLIPGEDLKDDLWLLIDGLAKSLPRSEAPAPVEAIPEPVLTLDQISKQLNVSTKTISRWREQGLIGRRVLHNGRWQLGFPESVVARFLESNRERVQRGSRFSQLTDDEKEDILRRAKRFARVSGSTLTEVSRRIARRLARSAETVRYTIKNYDREHPQQALFPDVTGPLPEDVKQVIYSSFRRGMSVETLADRFHRTRTSIYRVVNEMRARELLSHPLDYIYHESFDAANAETAIMASMPKAEEYEMQRRKMKPPKEVAPEMAYLYEEPLLSREQEYHLFCQMNFLKWQAAKLREKLDARNARTQDLERIEKLQEQFTAVKERLIRCNLRLVVSIAKKHVNPTDDFWELQSDGNMSLIRAVEKFDFGRGNKFSTYASWAIMKNFARSIPDEKHHRERFQSGHEEMFDGAPDKRSNELECVTSQEQSKKQVNHLLETLLDPRERQIIRMRAGMDNYAENMTLEEIGQQLNITKERVRQLHVRAMKKLQSNIRTQKVALS